MAKDPDKTEKATPRRREKAREEGQVAKSMDIAISASLVSVFLALLFYIPYAFKKLYGIFVQLLSDPLHNIPEYNYAIVYEIVKYLGVLLLPIFLLLLTVLLL